MATVLVTGANRGIGLEFCRQYVEAGWKVLACCRQPSAAHELQRLAARHSGLSVHELDVARFDQVDALSVQLRGATIDVLLANAGIYGDHDRHGFGAVDYRRWQETMNVNTLAPVKLLEAFLPQLQRSERKLMVAITSLMGSMADNRGGGALFYRSSKAALNAAMRTLSIDLRPSGVGIIILHPGWVRTDMGGEQAPTSAAESVSGMRQVIDEFHIQDTGCFVNFRGETLPW